MKNLIINNTHLMKEWNWEKNNSLDIFPDQLTCGNSKIKVWWGCSKCSYNWSASPNNRSKGTGCPVCANTIVIAGRNDLATLYPEVAKRWHPTLNKLNPTEVLPGSNKKAYFTCDKDSRHYFYTRINHMVADNTQCPVCANQKIIVGVNDLATTHSDLIKEWDYEKNVKVKPTEVTYGKNIKVWWKCKNNHSWQATICSRAGDQRTGCPICKKELFVSFPEKAISFYLSQLFQIEENKKFEWLGNSEVDIYIPELKLAIEYDGQAWHKDFKRDLKKDILCNDNKIALIRVRENQCPHYESSSYKIICKKGNFDELKQSIESVMKFINQQYNKNFIISIDIERDYNTILNKMDLMTKENSIANSVLIKEWNYDKNKGVNPATIRLGSDKKFWWKCQYGHEGESTVSSRSGKQQCGCPYCAGQKVIAGWNDLATLYPGIAKEWNYEKNKTTPNEIRPQTNKKYWWVCGVCGYEWETPPSHRVSGKGCHRCGREKTIASHFKKVLCVETGEIYKSVKEASLNSGTKAVNISNCCRGNSKTAGGYHWKYV